MIDHSPFDAWCDPCGRVTLIRYLDCDECKEKEQECIYICSECGCEFDDAKTLDTMKASEEVLKKDWSTPEEDKAWENL
jgi:hypothetical protein